MTDPLLPQHRCSVLVVDDDAEVRELLCFSLAQTGYEVAAVNNGREALHYLRSHAQTCMIVLDLALPTMDGVQFRSAQLRDRSLAWIPVVVVSGAPDARQKARELGARSFVSKPVDLDLMKQALRHISCYNARPRAASPDSSVLPA